MSSREIPNQSFQIERNDKNLSIYVVLADNEELHSRYLSSGDTWENSNLERFLEAMTAYAKDIQGYYDNTSQDINADLPSWKVFADILRGATIYE